MWVFFQHPGSQVGVRAAQGAGAHRVVIRFPRLQPTELCLGVRSTHFGCWHSTAPRPPRHSQQGKGQRWAGVHAWHPQARTELWVRTWRPLGSWGWQDTAPLPETLPTHSFLWVSPCLLPNGSGSHAHNPAQGHPTASPFGEDACPSPGTHCGCLGRTPRVPRVPRARAGCLWALRPESPP